MNRVFKKLMNRLLYQGRSGTALRCYEVAALYGFRELLSESDKHKFDESWEVHDDVHRESNDMIVWTWSYDDACAGATLKSDPLNLRLFGTQGTGSVKAASANIASDMLPGESLIVDYYYADGIGPSLYFSRQPAKYFDVDNNCMEISEPFSQIDKNSLPQITAYLVPEHEQKLHRSRFT